MNGINALGFIEVYGLVPGFEAADAMLKSAQVRLLRQYEVRPGMITLVIEGDLAACRAAVDAGVAAASRIGTVIASNVIARPDTDTETMVLDLIPGARAASPARAHDAGQSQETARHRETAVATKPKSGATAKPKSGTAAKPKPGTRRKP